MSIRLRVILLFMGLVGLGFYFLTDWIVDDLRVRYKESVEEVLVDTSQVLSALIASEIQQERVRAAQFDNAFQAIKKRFIQEAMDPLLEKHPESRVYVTNRQGVILFDSLTAGNEGEDYSGWRDVSLTLKGQYGARFSVETIQEEKRRMRYVAAPIQPDEEVVGVVSVGGLQLEQELAEEAQTLSQWIMRELQKEQLKIDNFKEAFRVVKQQSLKAHIFHLTKTQVDLHVYVTDEEGKVLFDSDDGKAEGEDYSKWRDVYLALRGQYGARTSRANPKDPQSTIMYVAAPIHGEAKIAGVVTVGKPTARINYFLRTASPQIWIAAGVAGVSVIFLGILFSTWMTRPIKRLTLYAKDIRDGKKRSLPKLGSSEIGVMGKTLEEMRQALEGKNYVESYIQSLTHELKSPLSAIRGAAELLNEDMSPEDQRRFLENIHREVGRMQEIVDRLLELAALEGRTELRNVENIGLHDLVEELRQKFDTQLLGKELQLQNNLVATQQVRGERFLLQQALSNLLQNAINFSPRGGTITIQAAEQGEFTVISIQDQGTGIPEFALGRIFERFYSLEQPDTKTKSSGLGLSFVKEIASLHQGDITIENRSPHGARANLRVRRFS